MMPTPIQCGAQHDAPSSSYSRCGTRCVHQVLIDAVRRRTVARKPDYSKGILDNARVNFAISRGRGPTGIHHLGISSRGWCGTCRDLRPSRPLKSPDTHRGQDCLLLRKVREVEDKRPAGHFVGDVCDARRQDRLRRDAPAFGGEETVSSCGVVWSKPRPMADPNLQVFFLCTCDSAHSIMARQS